MKFPKNRANVFCVVRETMDTTGAWANPTVCGAFEHYDDAEEYAAACTQEWVDKVGSANYVKFTNQMSTFYA